MKVYITFQMDEEWTSFSSDILDVAFMETNEEDFPDHSQFVFEDSQIGNVPPQSSDEQADVAFRADQNDFPDDSFSLFQTPVEVEVAETEIEVHSS